MRDAAPDRAPVSDRTVGDSARRSRQPSVAGVRYDAVLNLRVGDGGSVANRLSVVMTVPQVGAGANVDEEIGLGKPQVQHRTERLSSREEFCESVRSGQRLDRVHCVPGANVVKGHGLHETALIPAFAVVSDARRPAVAVRFIATADIAQGSTATRLRTLSTTAVVRR